APVPSVTVPVSVPTSPVTVAVPTPLVPSVSVPRVSAAVTATAPSSTRLARSVAAHANWNTRKVTGNPDAQGKARKAHGRPAVAARGGAVIGRALQSATVVTDRAFP